MIYIIQCLCPSRHCILGLAVDDAAISITDAETGFQSLIDQMKTDGSIDPWCGICRSRDWHMESGLTKYKTLNEAEPLLHQLQEENAATREFFQRSRN